MIPHSTQSWSHSGCCCLTRPHVQGWRQEDKEGDNSQNDSPADSEGFHTSITTRAVHWCKHVIFPKHVVFPTMKPTQIIYCKNSQEQFEANLQRICGKHVNASGFSSLARCNMLHPGQTDHSKTKIEGLFLSIQQHKCIPINWTDVNVKK